jgi:predicted porin
MKKSLIALAVAGAFTAPAFAATENVDVYGKLHASVSAFDDQPVGTNDVQISSNASRFGIKGAEDLGGGLSGIWQIESGVNLDEQNGTLSNRNSFVGLKGGFGTVLLGNHDTPLKLVGRAVDLFGDTMGDSRNVNGVGSDTRAKNVLAYITPNMGGFGIAAAYSTDLDLPVAGVAGGAAGDKEDVGLYNLNATYNNGPIFVGLGYGDGDGHEALGLGAQVRVAAGLTFGPAKIVAQYDTLEDDSHVQGQAGDFESFMVGAGFTFGNVVLKANYVEGTYDGDINAVRLVGTPPVVTAAPQAGRDVEQFNVGVDYNLSKRTTVYALYTAGTNVTLGKGAGSSDQIAGADVVGDDDVAALSLGVVHSF